jgi:oligopeptide/dipeptide ABC transporter ATP-binding protein
VRFIADHIAVLYLGKIVEMGSCEEIFSSPQHPYTKMLLKSVPRIGEPLAYEAVKGDLPSPLDPPPGCAFQTRCQFADQKCREEEPQLVKLKQLVACHHSGGSL